MDTNTMLSAKARRVVEEAGQFWDTYPNYSSEGALLAGMLIEGSGIAAKALKAGGCDLVKLSAAIQKTAATAGCAPKLSELNYYVDMAWQEAKRLGDPFIGTEHLLLSVSKCETSVDLFKQLGLDPNAMSATVLRLLGLPFAEVGEPYRTGIRNSES